jgi:glycerol-3-phosphate acyltransferase PlsY
MLAPLAAAAALLLFVASVWLTKYVSLGSVIASAALPPVAYASGQATPIVLAGAASAALIVFRHRSNLARLRAGTERRFGRARR